MNLASKGFEQNLQRHKESEKNVQVSQLEDELHSLIKNSNTTVKNLEDFIRNNAKDLHTKHYLNLMGNFQSSRIIWVFISFPLTALM